LCEEPKELTIKGLLMGCHWHSVLITGHDMKHVMVELYTLPSNLLFIK